MNDEASSEELSVTNGSDVLTNGLKSRSDLKQRVIAFKISHVCDFKNLTITKWFWGHQITVKEGHADEVAQFFADLTFFLRAEFAAKKEELRYGKLARDGNVFYAWEEFVKRVPKE